jgi:hypothetical protein
MIFSAVPLLRRNLLQAVATAAFVFAAAARAQQGTFIPTGSMNTARYWHTATLLHNGKVLIAGGALANTDALASAELYDPTSGSFAMTGNMTAARTRHTATLLADGRVLIIGGVAGDGRGGATSAELYDPTTGRFTTTGSMLIGRDGHTATLLISGKVLVVGGWLNRPPNHSLDSAELYDPAAGTFAPGGAMTRSWFGQTATLLLDGTVLFASPFERAATGELYDPATGAFTRKGPVVTFALYWHTATLLKDGRVLISGGGTPTQQDPLPMPRCMVPAVEPLRPQVTWLALATCTRRRDFPTVQF